jgi:hypothetical protein
MRIEYSILRFFISLGRIALKQYMLLMSILVVIFIPCIGQAQIDPNDSYKRSRKYMTYFIDYGIDVPGPAGGSSLNEPNGSSDDEEALFATYSFSDTGTTYNVELYYRPLGRRIRLRVLAGDKELHGLFNRFYSIDPTRQIMIFVVREDNHPLIHMNMGQLSLEETSLNTDVIYDALETFNTKSYPQAGRLPIFVYKPPGLLKKTCRASMGKSYLVNEEGQVDEFSLENLRIAYRREGITAQNQEDFERIARSLIKAEDESSNYETILISDVNDIPRYSSHPLDSENEDKISSPLSYNENMTDYWICYTYRRLGGIVSRYEFGFQEGELTSVKKLVLGNRIGAALFIPGIPFYGSRAVNRSQQNRRITDRSSRPHISEDMDGKSPLFSTSSLRTIFITTGVLLLVIAYIVKKLISHGSAIAKQTVTASPPPTEQNRDMP